MKRTDQPAAVTTWRPDELGWKRIGERTWEKPDGTFYAFPPGIPGAPSRDAVRRFLQ